MMFKCQSCQMFDDGRVNLLKLTEYTYGNTSERMPPSIMTVAKSLSDDRLRVEMLRRWCYGVKDYVSRDMSNPMDRLTALAGIARFTATTVQCDYLFGIWADDLIILHEDEMLNAVALPSSDQNATALTAGQNLHTHVQTISAASRVWAKAGSVVRLPELSFARIEKFI